MPVVPLHRPDAPHPQARACADCELRSLALFAALDEPGLARIHTHIAHLELPPGRALYEAGGQGKAVYTLREGIVRLERVTERGDRRVVRLAGRGDLLAAESLLGRAHAEEAIACTAVVLCRIPVQVMDSLTACEPGLVHELMRRWQQALEDSHAWAEELASGPARRRVLKLLAKLGEYTPAGQPIWLPKREEIGAMLGLTIETASRQISQLRREGVLRDEGLRHARVDAVGLQLALQQQDRAC
jgi:CRP/FNR family transcriptional regulator, anaerobic regulatory protein